MSEPGPRCGFCFNTRDNVCKLIAGYDAYICNECIAICHDILKNQNLEHMKTADQYPVVLAAYEKVLEAIQDYHMMVKLHSSVQPSD